MYVCMYVCRQTHRQSGQFAICRIFAAAGQLSVGAKLQFQLKKKNCKKKKKCRK
jgi:hypothetical protein